MSRTMTLRAVLVFFCTVHLTVTAKAADNDLKQLQGTWIGTEDGQEDKGKVTLSIEGNRIEFQGWHPKEWYKGTIELGEKDDTNKIYATIKDCAVPEFVGKVCNGMYAIDADSLTIAARGPGDPKQPSGFDDPESRTFSVKKQR